MMIYQGLKYTVSVKIFDIGQWLFDGRIKQTRYRHVQDTELQEYSMTTTTGN